MRGRAVDRASLPGERGVTTIFTAGVIALVMAFAMLLLQVALIVAAKHRVQAGADLAALAGSAAAARGDDACGAAQAVAVRNEVGLSACRAELAVVTVRTRANPLRVLGVRWRPDARARAAPDYYVRPSEIDAP